MHRTWSNRSTKVMLVAGAILVSALTFQLRSSRREIRVWTDRAYSLLPGSLAPRAELRTVDGHAVELGRTEASGQIYFVYRTDCAYCTRSLAAWQEISTTVEKTPDVQVLGISLNSEEATRRFLADNRISFTSVSLQDARLIDLHRFWIVPQVLVLNSEGRVLFSRIGVLETRAAVDSVLEELGGLVDGSLPTADPEIPSEATRHSRD